jgi:hypothetical protein
MTASGWSGGGRRLVAVLVLLAAVLLAGCAQLGGAVQMGKELRAIGIKDAKVNVSTTQAGTTVTIAYASAQKTLDAVDTEVRRVQEVTWRKFPTRFDELVVTPATETDFGVPPSITATRDELQAALGPRPAELDKAPDSGGIVTGVLVGLAVFLLVVVGIIVLIVVLVRRKRRRGPPPGQGWGGPPPGWGGPPQQTWGGPPGAGPPPPGGYQGPPPGGYQGPGPG